MARLRDAEQGRTALGERRANRAARRRGRELVLELDAHPHERRRIAADVDRVVDPDAGLLGLGGDEGKGVGARRGALAGDNGVVGGDLVGVVPVAEAVGKVAVGEVGAGGGGGLAEGDGR